MPGSRVLLTGATGLLGRYLLRNLLSRGAEVAVLARDSAAGTCYRRIDELLAWWEESLGARLPRPVVLPGDVCRPGLGLTPGARRWLGRRCAAVVHAAAHVGFRPTPDGEPWKTNVEGTRHVLELCAEAGAPLHHVSTAFVCGDRAGPVREDELDLGQAFHNDYEKSKCEAEALVRRAAGPLATV